MSAIKDPITKEVIASSLGAQWNDRTVQIFTTLAELRGGIYTGWFPVRGSLGYAEDSRTLYEVVDFTPGGVPIWEPVAPRGAIAHLPTDWTGYNKTVLLPASGAVTEILKLTGSVRYGRSYGFAFSGSHYTPSGNLGLWYGFVFVARKTDPNTAIYAYEPGGSVRRAGEGWATGVFGSQAIGGFAVCGPLAANEAECEFSWRGYSYPGLPEMLIVNPSLSIVEMGSHKTA